MNKYAIFALRRTASSAMRVVFTSVSLVFISSASWAEIAPITLNCWIDGVEEMQSIRLRPNTYKIYLNQTELSSLIELEGWLIATATTPSMGKAYSLVFDINTGLFSGMNLTTLNGLVEFRGRCFAPLSTAQSQTGAAEDYADRQAALLALANAALMQEQALSADSLQQVALLNEQVSTLRGEINRLQSLLNLATENSPSDGMQVEALTRDLNTAMARALLAERRLRVLEDLVPVPP